MTSNHGTFYSPKSSLLCGCPRIIAYRSGWIVVHPHLFNRPRACLCRLLLPVSLVPPPSALPASFYAPPPLSLVYGQATRGDLRPLVVRGWGVSMSQPLCRRDRVTSSRDICPGGTSQDPKPNRHKAPPFTPGVDQKLAGEAGPTTAVLPTPGTAASTCTTCWLPLPPSAPYIL